MAEPNQPSIFISYSRKDKEFVQRLAGDLDRAGYDTWWDVGDLRGGQAWAIEIEKHVRACPVFLVVLSPDSKNSDWVSKETLLALDLHKIIVPLMWRESSLPLPLVDRQFVDFRGSYANAFQELLTALPPLPGSQVVTPSAPPATPTRASTAETIQISKANIWKIAAAGVLVILGLTWIIGSKLSSVQQISPTMSVSPSLTGYLDLTDTPTGEATVDLSGTATARLVTQLALKTAVIRDTQTVAILQTHAAGTASANASQTKQAGEKTRLANAMLSNWPMAGHDSANTSWNLDETVLKPPLVKQWQFTPLEGIDYFENVSVDSETVLMAGTANGQTRQVLVAINANSGKYYWRYDLAGGKGSIGIQPAINKELAYIGGQGDDHLYAPNLFSGKLIWQLAGIGGLFGRNPLVVGDKVFVGAMDSQQRILAVDGQNGKIQWEAAGESRQTDYIFNRVTLARGNGQLVGLDIRNGKKIWETSGQAGFHLTANDELIFTTYTGDTPEQIAEYPYYRFDRVAGFDKYGKQVWETKLEPNLLYARLAYDGKQLYVLTWNPEDPNSRLYTINPQNGALVKRVSLNARFHQIAGANQALYLCGEALIAVNASSLKTVWQAGAGECSNLAIANGLLYVINPGADGLTVYGP